MAEAVSEEYRSSLTDLNFNSKPHINMLTMLAEENVKFAPVIVDTILTHIKNVPPDLKLPSLYLVDSIMKNIGGQYITLFSKHMISLFSSVFEKVEETTRSALYKLRQTWNDILPKNVLYGVDRTVNTIDPAWPITAMVSAPVSSAPSKNPIHVNPKFLGGPNTSAQCPTAAKNQEKPVATFRTELVTKDKDTEVLEMKKKQEEMLKLIEEKKNQLKALQLKALEQKKGDMVAKQKKNPALEAALPVPVAPHQHIQKKVMNHRDPRLKKSMAISQTSDVKGADKPGATSLQSVVVVPNTRLQPDATLKSNGNVVATAAAKTKDIKSNVLSNNTFPASNEHKGAKNADKSPKDKHNTRELLSRHCKINKKHSTSPENKLGANAKKFCKQPVGKPKRLHEDNLELKKNESPPSKKHKNDFSKTKNNHSVGLHASEERRPEAVLFGTEDKDYRHQVRAEERLQSKRWPQSQPVNMHPPKTIKQEVFDPKDHDSTSLPDSIPDGNLYPHEKIVEHNLILKKPCVETYIPPVIDNFVAGSHKSMDGRLIETKTFKLEENLDRNYTSKPIMTKERPPPPSTTSIVLDGKNRTIHFVNDRALTIMDNSEPKEVAFAGPPRNVHVEGMPHPLLLEFDGRQVEFLTEGKRNFLRFGTPSREIYVNNYPYEAKFGGPHITAILEDQKEHKIRIDGPPPQVIISEKPAYELYEHFTRNNILQNAKNIKKEPEDAALLQDVDMRVKPSHVQSTILPECKKDVDWRHVASASDPNQVPWNVQQNSFETYNDVPGARNYTPGVSNIPPQMDFRQNPNVNHSTWPHPGYREIADRPPFEQLHHMEQKPKRMSPNTTWDQIQPPSTLPPPPSIPLSLNISTQGNLSLSGPPLPPNMPQMPNLSIPPPSWNPLPPPPMFTGAVADTLGMVSVGSNPNPTSEPAPPLPSINVETIYEKLVAAGIISKKTEEPKSSSAETANNEEKKEEEEPEEEDIVLPDIRLTPKSLRQFNPGVIALLYQGTQCATCGMRFKEIQSEQYSRHLDWHFRMNRREKDGAKKAYSRRWYYTIQDWIQFKEIEEAEERTPSYFELQADGESSKNEEKEKIQSVPASECESEKCSVCGEQFQLFWVEEEEEWHLKHAVRHEGEAYHPMCYEDHKKATELANREPEVPDENPTDSMKEEGDEPTSADNSTTEVKMEATSEEEIKVEAVKEEKEDDPNKDQASSQTVAETGKSETPLTVPLTENQAEVSTQEDKDSSEEKVLETEALKPEASSIESETEEKAKTEEKISVPEIKDTNLKSEGEPEEKQEEEFRPPTPDPRFKVLPAVFKGTELSALCTIM